MRHEKEKRSDNMELRAHVYQSSGGSVKAGRTTTSGLKILQPPCLVCGERERNKRCIAN